MKRIKPQVSAAARRADSPWPGHAPQYVEDAITSSPGVLQANGNISHLSGSLRVILNKDGAVVTIITE